jgi:uncharacterized membrane protein (UPF0127 family)
MWLCAEERVFASAEMASTRRARRRGLLGRDGVDGAFVFPHTRAVHTMGMKFAIDVAYLDPDGVVLDVQSMRPWRVGRPRWRARTGVEAERGAFERWGVHIGDRLEVR